MVRQSWCRGCRRGCGAVAGRVLPPLCSQMYFPSCSSLRYKMEKSIVVAKSHCSGVLWKDREKIGFLQAVPTEVAFNGDLVEHYLEEDTGLCKITPKRSISCRDIWEQQPLAVSIETCSHCWEVGATLHCLFLLPASPHPCSGWLKTSRVTNTSYVITYTNLVSLSWTWKGIQQSWLPPACKILGDRWGLCLGGHSGVLWLPLQLGIVPGVFRS